MIYMLGMSHMLTVLNACGAGPAGAAWQSFPPGLEPRFVDWETRPELIEGPVQAAHIHISCYVPHWGPALSRPTGTGQLGVALGFQKLLGQIGPDSGQDLVLVFMRGEEPFHLGLDPRQAPYDFFMPERPDLPPEPGRQPLPLTLVHELMRRVTQQSVHDLMAIRAFCPGKRVVWVCCPPLVQADWLRQVDPVTEHLPPDGFRIKHHQLYLQTMSAALAPLGIHTLPPPPQAVDERGLLKSEFTRDRLHGNADYGALVLQQVKELQTTP